MLRVQEDVASGIEPKWLTEAGSELLVKRIAESLTNVAESRHIPVLPTLEQAELLTATEPEALLAGTARSAKTIGVLISLVAAMDRPCSAVLVVPALATSPAPTLLRAWLQGTEARWDPKIGSTGSWRFPSGGTLGVSHRRALPSAGYQVIGVDDLVEFGEDEYRRLLALLTPHPELIQAPLMRAASSPDGPGRNWVARHFGLDGRPASGSGRRVVVAGYKSNPHVDSEGVRRALAGLPEPRRSRLLLGDWTAGDREEQDEPSEESEDDGMFNGEKEEPVRLRALLGHAGEREVWFDPYLPRRPLPNCHLLATGETGSGKTQTVMAVAAELRAKGVAPVMLDFSKDDYSQEWAAEQGLEVIDPSIGRRLPFNPLAAVADPATSYVNGLHQIHRAVDIVKRVWRLGDQQAFRFREAAKAAYQEAGLPLDPYRPEKTLIYPGLQEVVARLDSEDPTRGRLSPLVDLDPFDQTTDGGVASLLTDGAVIRLTGLPGDEAKASVGEFLLLALYHEMRAHGHVLGLRWVLGLDEAHRVASSPFLEPILRESRAFGLGVMLATQFPRDLSLVVKGCCATQLYFGQTQLEQIAEIQRAVHGETRGREASRLAQALRTLTPCHAVVHSRASWGLVKVKPYFERGTSRLSGSTDTVVQDPVL
ncbi:MAG: ATP-binding protein [Candidatus Dormibacter sp.]|uniref:ATP-binding protein n=1 Tax=Candidatus Dormibacter sp. TaxID=2973982 RepID=UPI000DB64410|nr:MAG: hypothetical protein DLM66_04905 [Candidatus Dormibacteraeota bacterium]